MKRLPIQLVVIVVFLALLNSCPESIPELNPDYTSSDSGQTVSMKPGDTFTVGLFAAPSTAYFWEIVELDASVVKNTASEYIPDPATKDMAGGGGTDIWSFEAVSAGTTTLKMENVQNSEPRDPRGEFELTINVTDS